MTGSVPDFGMKRTRPVGQSSVLEIHEGGRGRTSVAGRSSRHVSRNRRPDGLTNVPKCEVATCDSELSFEKHAQDRELYQEMSVQECLCYEALQPDLEVQPTVCLHTRASRSRNHSCGPMLRLDRCVGDARVGPTGGSACPAFRSRLFRPASSSSSSFPSAKLLENDGARDCSPQRRPTGIVSPRSSNELGH